MDILTDFLQPFLTLLFDFIEALVDLFATFISSDDGTDTLI